MKRYSKHLFAWTLAVCVFGTAPVVSQKKSCSKTKAKQAELATGSLKTWNSVYRFYKRFSHCDDGSIAEGASDAVAKLLANRWDSFSEFVKLANSDGGFETFVVRHVDETIDFTYDAPKIHENARLNCPANSARLCKVLIERTTPQGR